MPDGDYKVGSAYVEIHLKDETQSDSAEIRSKIEGEQPVSLKTALQGPHNIAAVREGTEAELKAAPVGIPTNPEPFTKPKLADYLAQMERNFKTAPPVEVPVQADDPVNEAWRQRIRESLKRTTFESLQVPLTPENEKWRRELAELIKETEKAVSADIPVDVAKATEFKEQVQFLARLAQEETRVRIPVEVDEDKAQQALRSLMSDVDSANEKNTGSFRNMATSTGAAWTGLGALLAGPVVIGALGLTATAVSGIAIAAEKNVPQVQQAFQTMKTEGVDALKNGFSSMTPAITASLGTVTEGLRSATPQLQALSGQLGPFLMTFSSALVKAAQTDLPMFTQTLANAAPFAQQMARGIQDLAVGVGNFFTHIDFSQASTAFQALLTDVGRLLPVVADLVNAVMPFANALLTSVIPAATNLANVFIGALSPAIHAIGSAISALGPVLNFMSGPTAAVLAGVVAFKALQSATGGLLSVFNTVSSGASALANRVLEVAGASGNSVGSFNLMTTAAKQQAVQAAASALATAQQTAAQAAANLATVEAAAASGSLTISEAQLTSARAAATAATTAEAEATENLAAAERATSFAFGPVGIAIGAVVAGLSFLATGHDKAGASASAQAQREQSLADALAKSNGVIDDNVRKLAVQTLGNYNAGDGFRNLNKDVLNLAGPQGLRLLQDAYLGNAQAGDQLKSMLEKVATEHTHTISVVEGLTTRMDHFHQTADGNTGALDDTGYAAKQLIDILNDGSGTFANATANMNANKQAASAGAQAVQLSAGQQAAATSIANRFGLSINDVVGALSRLPGAGIAGAAGVSQVTSAFTDQEVKLLNAEQTIDDYFKNLQKNAAQANQSVVSAQHSYQQSITAVADAEHSAAQAAQAVTAARQGVVTATRAVTDAEHSYVDAEHSVAQAHQAVKDAEDGVITAENNLAKAQDAERQAQVALTKAREDAAEQLKSLHLQLNDQIASEQRAQIALFDQVAKSGAQGVTKDNAQSILAQPLTTQNEALKKSALDLVDAENSLADTMNTGANLRKQVAEADSAGVEGSQQVVSAQRSLKQAQDQVTSSEQALLKSHQQVTQAVYGLQDAEYALGKAHQAIIDAQANVVKSQQAVRDAVYNEQKARQAVQDAIFNERQALLALKSAQDAATSANDLNTRSLDLNTQAGRNNWAQLQTLFDSYPAWMSQTQKYNQMVQDTADKFGISKKAAFDFLQQQGKIDPNFKFTTTGVAAIDLSPLQQYLGNKGVDVMVNGVRANFAEGGEIQGPGGPKDDIIPIMASAGEFMQPADVVEHYGIGFMEDLRKKKLPKYANGGLIAGNTTGDIYGSGYVTASTVAKVMGIPNIPMMPAYVPPPPLSLGPVPGVPSSRAGNRAIVLDTFASMFGWSSPAEIAATDYLMMRESGYNNVAQNPTSTAYGMFQFLDSTWGGYGVPKTSDPKQQSIAGARYISSRYTDPIGAAAHEKAFNWYAKGDIVGTDGSSLLGVMAPKAQIVPSRSERVVGDNKRVPEAYVPIEPSDPRSQQILSETNRRMGRSNNAPVVNITLHTNETDPERLASLVSSRIGWAMRGV